MANWSEKQFALQMWQATPEKWKQSPYKTKKQIMEKLQIGEETANNWSLEPGWWDAVFSMTRGIVGERLGAILETMADRAEGGSVQAAKLCLQVLGVHADKLELEHSYNDDQLVLIMNDVPRLTQGEE